MRRRSGGEVLSDTISWALLLAMSYALWLFMFRLALDVDGELSRAAAGVVAVLLTERGTSARRAQRELERRRRR